MVFSGCYTLGYEVEGGEAWLLDGELEIQLDARSIPQRRSPLSRWMFAPAWRCCAGTMGSLPVAQPSSPLHCAPHVARGQSDAH